MKIKDVLTQNELDSLKMHENWLGNIIPDWVLDALVWKGKELEIRDFALLYIAHELHEMRINQEF